MSQVMISHIEDSIKDIILLLHMSKQRLTNGKRQLALVPKLMLFPPLIVLMPLCLESVSPVSVSVLILAHIFHSARTPQETNVHLPVNGWKCEL